MQEVHSAQVDTSPHAPTPPSISIRTTWLRGLRGSDAVRVLKTVPSGCSRQHASVIIVQHSEALLGEEVPPLITVVVLDMMATSAPIEIIAQSFEIALPNRPLDRQALRDE